MKKMIELQCEICQDKFLRYKSEADRNARLDRRIFCSISCAAKGMDNFGDRRNTSAEHLKNINRKDEFTPFRWHLNNARSRDKRHYDRHHYDKGFDIDLPYLKEQWERQGGICPYTGWKLKNLKSTCVSASLPKTPDRASLDKIDSSKGYIKGNVQFISMMANFAKLDWSESELISFCTSVVKNNSESEPTDYSI